jgi:hypothetical protein
MPRIGSTRLIAVAIGLFCADVNVEHSSILVNYERGVGLDVQRAKKFISVAQGKAGGESRAARQMRGS